MILMFNNYNFMYVYVYVYICVIKHLAIFQQGFFCDIIFRTIFNPFFRNIFNPFLSHFFENAIAKMNLLVACTIYLSALFTQF